MQLIESPAQLAASLAIVSVILCIACSIFTELQTVALYVKSINTSCATEGAEEGRAERLGSCDDWPVGLNDSLGTIVGVNDGILDGDVLGDDDGKDDGTPLGNLLGSADGDTDGL